MLSQILKACVLSLPQQNAPRNFELTGPSRSAPSCSRPRHTSCFSQWRTRRRWRSHTKRKRWARCAAPSRRLRAALGARARRLDRRASRPLNSRRRASRAPQTVDFAGPRPRRQRQPRRQVRHVERPLNSLRAAARPGRSANGGALTVNNNIKNEARTGGPRRRPAAGARSGTGTRGTRGARPMGSRP